MGNALEEVDSFSYLGSEVGQTARVNRDVGVRLEKAATVYRMWRRKVFRSQTLSKETKCPFSCMEPRLGKLSNRTSEGYRPSR